MKSQIRSAALLLAAALAGCGGGGTGGSAASSQPSAHSLARVDAPPPAPMVTSTSPADGAQDVTAASAVSATFDQAMDPSTILPATGQQPTTLTVTDSASGQQVQGRLSMDDSHAVATFTPTSALAPGARYTAVVGVAAKSAFGSGLATPYSWSFKTKAAGAVGALAPVQLGMAGDFVLLSKSGISTVPNSWLVGNIGVSPIARAAMTGFSDTADSSNTFSTSQQVSGKMYAANFSVPTPAYMTNSVYAMEAAYVDAAGRPNPIATELGAGEIGGLTLAPGVYKWGTGLLISTDMTLNGGPDDVWIFQVAGTMTQAVGTTVRLTGGAQAKNVFWVVADVVALNADSHLEGIVLAQTMIAMKARASVNGRLFAQTAITLDQNRVVQPAP